MTEQHQQDQQDQQDQQVQPAQQDEQAPGYVFVEDLPDLIQPEEYADHPEGRLVRLRVTVTDDGVTVLGDGFRPAAVEALLAALGGGPIEQMLCG
jgi:hypothetical protein